MTEHRSFRVGPGRRAVDVAASAVLVLLTAPLVLVAAVLILLTDGRPVLFRQERVGEDGVPFRLTKLRTMRAAPAGGAAEVTATGDPRITRLGAALRRTSIDELPQLWHVLTGEMSLVGPRPESPTFVALFPDDYEVILQVRPGLTGYTQVAFAREGDILDPQDPHAHYLSSVMPQKVALDRLYASRPSLVRDIRIMIATAVTLAGQPVAVNRTTGALTLRRRPEPGPAGATGGDTPRARHGRERPVDGPGRRPS